MLPRLHVSAVGSGLHFFFAISASMVNSTGGPPSFATKDALPDTQDIPNSQDAQVIEDDCFSQDTQVIEGDIHGRDIIHSADGKKTECIAADDKKAECIAGGDKKTECIAGDGEGHSSEGSRKRDLADAVDVKAVHAKLIRLMMEDPRKREYSLKGPESRTLPLEESL